MGTQSPDLPPCRYCGKSHVPGSELPLEDWPWRAIVSLERRVTQRFSRRPRCELCDRPMVCGQEGSHYACLHLVDVLQNGP
jgi:hypothetical protein